MKPSVSTTLGLLIAFSHTTPALACSNQALAAVIDQTGEQLRIHNLQSKPQIDTKIRTLAQKRGWSEAETEPRITELLHDRAGLAADEKAAELLMRLDRLGDSDQDQKPASLCARLKDAERTAQSLLVASHTRTKQMLAKLDSELAGQSVATANDSPSDSRTPTLRQNVAKSVQQPRKIPPQAKNKPWTTQAFTTPPSENPPPGLGVTTAPLDPTYSSDEIAAAGRGLFGSISSNLAAVIQYAFATYGRPTGYILGTEGGGAFIAGLRYGTGQLSMKDGSAIKVHWQGPSVGYDVGVAGSRVMFLVYNINNSLSVFKRFAGIDGSAYVVGGAGITFLKRGDIILAPIRTGLGLRFGANVGYLKFTSEPSLNPF